MSKRTLIIGAGPAGLCFANTLATQFGDTNFVLVDMGKPVMQREHDSAQDIACGEGGNGLFSDGKFSFFPAGTNVWTMCYHILKQSYAQLTEFLGKYTDAMSEMPSEDDVRNYFFEVLNNWTLKKYPTVYLTLEDRKRLIGDITSGIPEKCLRFQHQVLECVYDVSSEAYIVYFKDLINSVVFVEVFDKIVLCGGRFFPLTIDRLFKQNPLPMVFRRYEFGVRIETSAANPAMIGIGEIKDLLDPKLRRKEDETTEFRTFCWCRNGETVLSEFNGMRTYSGRSDCDETSKSNFGFLVRITDDTQITSDEFQLIAHTKPFDISLNEALETDVLSQVYGQYGQKIGGLIQRALISITDEFPQLKCAESKILGPSIEGMGMYPDIDHNLKVKNDPNSSVVHNVYCLGDNTGIFRGIVPCMISGFYLARSFHYPLTKDITFVTGNENKIRETERIIGPLTISRMDLPEFQGTPETIAVQKCKLAAERIGGPVIVEDTSLCYNALGGLPGPFVKWFLEWAGPTKMVRMLDGFADKTAYAKCIFAYSRGPEHEPQLFVGITHGTIVEPRGNSSFGWDPIFQPDGYAFTYAELDNGVKNKISHRFKAIRALEKYLYESNGNDESNAKELLLGALHKQPCYKLGPVAQKILE